MPRASSFTSTQIIDAALALVRESGMDALTARALGARLGASAKPIFSVFPGKMAQVREETLRAARECYNGYVRSGLSASPAFKGVGMAYLRFAAEEPQLFRLLFMTERYGQTDVPGILPQLDDSYAAILASITDGYAVSDADAHRLYEHLWVYTHGIATLLATHVCTLTPAQSGAMLTDIFIALLHTCKPNS